MIRRATGIAAWSSLAMTCGLLGAGAVVLAMTPPERLPAPMRPDMGFQIVFLAYLLTTAVVGAVVASRRPAQAIGWLMCATAMLVSLSGLGLFYARFGLAYGRTDLFAAAWLAWLANLLWGLGIALQLVVLPVLFPDGRPASRRWTGLLIAAAALVVADTIGTALDTGAYGQVISVGVRGGSLILGAAALGSVFVRLWTATGERRQQLKWFASALTFTVIVLVAGQGAQEAFGKTLPAVLYGAASLSIPVSIGFAVLRYRLYDIDVVVNRTLVYGALAVLLTILYSSVVVGLGSLLSRGGEAVPSLMATALVALAFQPARGRIQWLVNRLVYGRSATPYDALAAPGRHGAEAASGEGWIREMARMTCHAIGARSAVFWHHSDGRMQPIAGWPESARHGPPKALGEAAGCLVAPDGALGVLIQHMGGCLGAISVTLPVGRSLSAADMRLLTDIANQAGLVLKNIRLTTELMARVEELRESRRRLVTAQDEERRRLERDLHDGAQQHLFGLKVNIRHARSLLGHDLAQSTSALQTLEEMAEEALQAVRALARGLYPPLLTAQGLPGALGARVRAVPLDVRLACDGVGRYPAEVEGAVYYCCSEALQNATRHAGASTVRISMRDEGGLFRFSVEDDGRGFAVDEQPSGTGLQGMRDRIDVIGGSLEIASSRLSGTRVAGRVPLYR